jgi:hypothetical protein
MLRGPRSGTLATQLFVSHFKQRPCAVGPLAPGPDLDIPRNIQYHFQLVRWHEEGRYHWPRFELHKLRAVQKVRFMELCQSTAGLATTRKPDAAHGVRAASRLA